MRGAMALCDGCPTLRLLLILHLHARGTALIYPLSNVLVDALPEESRRTLLVQLSRVNLPIRTSLYEPGERPRFAHFLTSGIASVVTTMADGTTAEIGTLGREGVPQGLHLLGETRIPTRCFMQIGGTGLRMDFCVLERLFNSDPALRRVFLAYAQYQTLMLGQVAGCNRLHDATERLARWLLMIQDRTGHSLLKLTQEFLAQMIGSQRTTVSEVASALQERRLIEYARGSIRILNRRGLENTSCECYVTTRNLLQEMYALARQTVFEEPAA
jgi:CRP-like cAMP-binding protein